ncbi:MAG TPA: Gfo/Idh/MocA family oxidoreductase [Gemmatimonadaceae bacterium]|nr:Gfo/Idh/MocA family oxidoreductase [Gemmatimonadaceae bacterium]
MKPEIRLGLVGVGAITQLAHLPALAKLRGVEVVALCDNDGPKASAIAERFGVSHVFTDIEDLLELEMDAVVIATPNHLHEPHVLSALRAGVHVLCERPVALTSRGVERILAASERTGRKVVVGTNHRFRSDVQQLARFLEGGELGQMKAIRAGEYRFRSPHRGWRGRRAEAGGGAFLEQGLALVDLALWLADFPKLSRVTASADGPKSATAVEDSMFVHVECASGLSIVCDTTWSYVGQEERWWFEVLCARGSARLAPLRVVKELNGKPVDVSPTGAAARESAFLQSYRAELAHFLSVVQGESRYDPPADQLLVHRLVEAVYKSAEDGKESRL